MEIKLHEPTFGEEETQAVTDVMRSTMVTSGEKVREFEKAFGENAVMCNSGSSANLLAVAALCNPVTENGLRPGDEVIVSALSWSTTVWPLVQHGLVPVIVDIDPETLNMLPGRVRKAIGPRTKAIMPVHVYGNPCDLDPIGSLVGLYDLWLIEDCCEALGATYRNTAVGQFGVFGTFSFYFSHHITTMEGGMVGAGSLEHAELLRILRAHGWLRDVEGGTANLSRRHNDIDPRFTFVNAGYNLRATEAQAAMGLVQLPKLEGFVARRRAAAEMLQATFERRHLRTQKETPGGKSSWFGFPIIPADDGGSRALRQHFEDNGIETRSIICGNIARQPGMKLFPHRVVGDLRHADHVMRNGFSIGCHQGMGEEECAYVAEVLDKFFA